MQTFGTNLDEFISKMSGHYQKVRSAWIQRQITRSETDSTSVSGMTAMHKSRGSRSSIRFGWTDVLTAEKTKGRK